MIFRRLVIPCLLALVPLAGAHADISFVERQGKYVRTLTVTVHGDITARDRDALAATAPTVSEVDSTTIVLDSIGGDLDAAMAMGRYIREMGLSVMVQRGAVCHSACVFLLAAGINKYPEGSIGIHRPYFRSGDPSYVAEAIRSTKSEAGAYFEEMNIPARLAEDMFSIDPFDMRILSAVELRDYRLNTKDYVANEIDTLQRAKDAGVSREVYEAYRRDLNATCPSGAFDLDCFAEVADRHNIPNPPLLGWIRNGE